MSKALRSILPVFALITAVFATADALTAQDIEVTIRLDPEKSIAHVEGRYLNAIARSKPLVFLSDYAGISLPHERISKVNQNGAEWSYDVDLKPMKSSAAKAHFSWLTKESGVLMLADLLPKTDRENNFRTAKVKLLDFEEAVSGLPKVTTSEKPLGDMTYLAADIDKAAFLLNFELSIVAEYPEYSRGNFVGITGVFQFTLKEAAVLTHEVYGQHAGLFGAERPLPLTIGVIRSRAESLPGLWHGATRGTTLLIVSSDMPFKSQSLQRLHEQLRHEMFHLWIPEGVNLTGNYDWFYEGFALYQSLKLGVAVNRLRFEDYLDSLSQAIAIDRRLGGKISLIEASKNRWSGDNNSVVYARGMLVAFMCDLAMLETSKGKRSTDDLVREVYRRHSGDAKPQDGNAAVLELMRSNKELGPIVERYVTGVEKLDMTTLLNAAGIESADGITLKTVAKPNSRQKKLLDKLGYNNWRKLSSTPK